MAELGQNPKPPRSSACVFMPGGCEERTHEKPPSGLDGRAEAIAAAGGCGSFWQGGSPEDLPAHPRRALGGARARPGGEPAAGACPWPESNPGPSVCGPTL